jgi:hypothetical protein
MLVFGTLVLQLERFLEFLFAAPDRRLEPLEDRGGLDLNIPLPPPVTTAVRPSRRNASETAGIGGRRSAMSKCAGGHRGGKGAHGDRKYQEMNERSVAVNSIR